jgi:outer membrane lipoprotein-sorting protein
MKDKKLSEYIDQLNKEVMPKEHRSSMGEEEYTGLTDTVRRVKGLKEPVMPDNGFEERLVSSVRKSMTGQQILRGSRRSGKVHPGYFKRTWITVAAAAAAVTLIFTVPELPLPWNHGSIVQAMEQAIKEVKAYHGILEVVETNELGETMTQSRREVWADSRGDYRLTELEGYQKDMITVNNGEHQWQLRPEEGKAFLFPAFPDPYRFSFELGKEVEDATNAQSVKEIGEDMIAGREAVILEVTPDGGDPYRLWIDKETDLPLQRQSAMQNAIQIKVTYTQIEFLDSIPEELLTYRLPQGYEEVEKDPEQVMSSIEEAESIAGFLPSLPEEIPGGYSLVQISYLPSSESIKLTYKNAGNIVVIHESTSAPEFNADPSAMIGAVNGITAEIMTHYQGQADTNSIRWQQQGMEYTVFGNIPTEELSVFAGNIAGGEVTLPNPSKETVRKPAIEVPYDLTVEENEQKSVDAGHSPWKLDPAFVAQVFANILISPEGIVGDYKIPYEAVKITSNNGTDAVAEIDSKDSIASYVYLRRLVRQDDTGIWTVVGYDPVN